MFVFVYAFAAGMDVGMAVLRPVGMRVLVDVRGVVVSVVGIGVIVRMRVLRAVGMRVRVGMLVVLHTREFAYGSSPSRPLRGLMNVTSGYARRTMYQQESTPRPYELRAQNAKSLLKRLYREVSALISEEAELAKAEVSERVGLLAVAARSLALAFALGVIALACVCAAVIAAIAIVLPFWVAALIVAALALGAALVANAAARPLLARATENLSGGTIAEGRSRVASTRQQVALTISALEQKTDLLAPLRDTALGLGSLAVAVGAIVRESPDSSRPRG